MAIYKKTAKEIAELLSAEIVCGEKEYASKTVYRIEYDSRKIEKNDIFVCLTGFKSDGHQFAAMAYSNGCRVFLCERKPILPGNALIMLVPNTRAALASLSAYFYDYPANKLKIIGVTGTKGKTTTALLISSILNKSGKSCAYIGSNGVIINGKRTETVNTTPESRDLHHYFALMLKADVHYAVMEVSSQSLISHRIDGIPFEIKIFTNLSPDHIGDGEHADFNEYRAAKASFFNGYTGTVIYNSDSPDAEAVIGGRGEGAGLISFGMETADFAGRGGSLYRDETALGIEFECMHANDSVPIKLRSPGAFSIYNGLAAIAAADCIGITPASSAAILAEISVTGRFEIVPGLAGRTFIIDYAHNGESMRRALAALREYAPSRLIVVFGSVGGRTKGRRRELAEAASALADISIISSDNPDFENPLDIINEIEFYMAPKHEYIKIPDREAAVRYAVRTSKPGDIVLFAGKGHETYQLIYGKKVPFIEADIIRDECMLAGTKNL